ncbi:EAL domain-containing protein [Nodularia harveyana UHCC-0300]|uniref:EAL domain-containing protein n=1 Tax=Nodularia harveyana UHCC-0300 TaxID=2974287 RepID=A0ABU5UKQ8_9CYAN|nr:EAL domain-containing protein [Nodularia harveyana]MEA5583665.1 EAL domain-containing protein [Nodularia harveyana UHCC-0300]
MPVNERERIRHLLVVQDLEKKQTIPLQETTYSLGRHRKNSIVLNSPSVSRQHAILLRVTIPETDQYSFRIIDGNFSGRGSSNGLLINGNKCFSHHLKHGDTVVFGDFQAQAQYYAVSNLSDQEFLASCQATDLSHLLEEQGNSVSHLQTLLIDPDDERINDTALARLASFPELIPNPIIEMDLKGKVTYLNPAAYVEFPELKRIGKNHPVLRDLMTLVLNHQENPFLREIQVGEKFFEQSVHFLPESYLIRTFIARDITAQKQAEFELQQRDRLLQAVAEAANNLLVEMNYEIAIDKALAVLGEAARVDRVYLFTNHIHSVTAETLVSLECEWTNINTGSSLQNWQNRTYQSPELKRWYDLLSSGQPIKGITREFPPGEQELLTKEGIKSLLLLPLRLEEQFSGFLGLADCSTERLWSKHEESTLLTMAASITAVWQRQQVEEKIRFQALHDLLTGLPNRLLFNEVLEKALPNALRSGESLAVMFVDLDRFKVINDTLGHTVGDRLLQEVAQRFKDSLRSGDTIARWGGDEFTILLPQVNYLEEVSQVAERILVSLENVFYLHEHELHISASIGIALLNKHSADAETLIQHADTALYYAKDKGRNNYQFYTNTLNTKTPEILTFEKSLRYALERKELKVYYQPKINIITRKVTGMEALLRWEHPEMGLIAPNVFIPIAEESGLIIPIGEWVLRTACLQNQVWQQAGFSPVTISVNLSPKQFHQPQLVNMVASILEQTGLAAQFLDLEITETTAIEDLEFSKTVLQNLAEMGVNLSIDDFGTGHSSLSRLQTLPFHNLKIDKSFIQELTKDIKVTHIVQAIVNLGQSLGLRLTAEGVEKQEELDFLALINCEDVQGFLFHKALSATKATEILQLEQKNL